jgi:cytochrome c peroxidase
MSETKFHRTLRRIKLWLFCTALFFLASCEKDTDKHAAFWEVPQGFPTPVYSFETNPRSVSVHELGRKLFYDPVLSLDSSISCASCHFQQFAFSDTLAFSLGFQDRVGRRNSPALFNLAWHTSFMHDGGINHLEVMPLAPITDTLEMAIPMRTLNQRLNSNAYYKKAFQHAFSTDSISDRQLLLALTQFMASLVSADSPYDKFIQGNTNALNAQEQSGLQLFRVNCASCHTEPLLTSHDFRNNGTWITGGDPGRQIITLQEEDRGKFKVPSLRNIAVTAPYMYDGRFQSLEQVLDHYATLDSDTPGLDQSLKTGIQLNPAEKQALLAFLNALTDHGFLSNKAFSNPFEGK